MAVPSNTLIRVVAQYSVQGVVCYTRAHFVSGASIDEEDVPSSLSVLMNEWGDRFRLALCVDAVVTQFVADFPAIPTIPPVVLTGLAPGARAGVSLPSHFYVQLGIWGTSVGVDRPQRNALRISGISAVDHREGHLHVNLSSTLGGIGQWLRDTTGLGAGLSARGAVQLRIPSTPPVWQFSRVFSYANEACVRSLKSRQR